MSDNSSPIKKRIAKEWLVALIVLGISLVLTLGIFLLNIKLEVDIYKSLNDAEKQLALQIEKDFVNKRKRIVKIDQEKNQVLVHRRVKRFNKNLLSKPTPYSVKSGNIINLDKLAKYLNWKNIQFFYIWLVFLFGIYGLFNLYRLTRWAIRTVRKK